VAGPSWLTGILAALMIATAAYCVSRLIISRTTGRAAEHDVDLAHAVMGVAMAGMLVTRLNPLPNQVWAVLFGGATAWFGWRVTRAYRARRAAGHHVPHLVMCGAMVYMLLAVAVVRSGSAAGRMAMGGTGGHFPVLALAFSLFMFGYVVWEADRLPALAAVRPAPAPAPADGPGAAAGDLSHPGHATRPGRSGTMGMMGTRGTLSRGPLSPRLAACCQIAMGITMGYMLILML
jgi:Domain of unknown function (DUF5134)